MHVNKANFIAMYCTKPQLLYMGVVRYLIAIYFKPKINI